MKRLAKYLKPYLWPVLLCVCLVFAQAMCDLKLPDYMSDIVNTGVMAGGIEDAVPEKLRLDTYYTLLAFMDAEQAELAGRYYTCVQNIESGAGWAEYQPPETLGRAERGQARQSLDSAFARAFTVKAALDQLSGLTAQQVAALPESTRQSVPAELWALVERGADVAAAVAQAEPETRAAVAQAVAARFDAMGEMAAGQIAALAIKAEYEAVGIDLAAVQRASILKTGGKMLAVALAVLLAAAGAAFLSARVAAGLARDLRQKLFEKVTAFSAADMGAFSTASLITRTTNDVQQVQQALTMMLRMLVYAPSMGVGGIVYAVQKSLSMSWIIAMAVMVLLGAMGLIFILVMPRFKLLQKLVDRLNLVTRESVSGIMVSRAYNTQAFEVARFDEANGDLAKTNLFVQRAIASMLPFINLVMSVLMLLIIWFGARQISQGGMMPGDMMAYLQYAMQVVMSFMFLGVMFIMLPRAAVSADRIAQVLETESTIADPAVPKAPATDPEERGLIVFEDVSLRYPGAERDALSGITFSARPGQTTAVIGATGSGKTSLINLILRFYDATGGRVRVGGQDVRDLRQHDLRGLIGYVPQKGVLFSGTIAQNIGLGAPGLDAPAMAQAAETAQALSFITAKEEGFEAHITQGGTNVSGGQRQRLSIARALATRAPILLFDDSFSALDFKTDAALRRALRESTREATLFIVAQRVGTIMHADQIIVLDEGRIVGLGDHQSLMASCPVYQDIARSQLREEELYG